MNIRYGVIILLCLFWFGWNQASQQRASAFMATRLTSLEMDNAPGPQKLPDPQPPSEGMTTADRQAVEQIRKMAESLPTREQLEARVGVVEKQGKEWEGMAGALSTALSAIKSQTNSAGISPEKMEALRKSLDEQSKSQTEEAKAVLALSNKIDDLGKALDVVKGNLDAQKKRQGDIVDAARITAMIDEKTKPLADWQAKGVSKDAVVTMLEEKTKPLKAVLDDLTGTLPQKYIARSEMDSISTSIANKCSLDIGASMEPLRGEISLLGKRLDAAKQDIGTLNTNEQKLAQCYRGLLDEVGKAVAGDQKTSP